MGIGTSDNRCRKCSNIRDTYGEKWVGSLAQIHLRKSALLCFDTYLVIFCCYTVLPIGSRDFKVGPFFEFGSF
jgi:hypothetical protein